MNIDEILQQLRAERDRIDHAINALQGTTAKAKRGRRPNAKATDAKPKKRGRRAMSVAERKKLSEQMKKRWAERKSQGQKGK